VYQEQVMQIARALAGYSLGGADLLRRAMGKKKKEVMEKEKAKFLDGAQKTGVDPKIADEVFDLMAAFAGYGFNKSHSAAYGLVTYQTAYLKKHFPAEFWAALLTCDKDDTDKVARYVSEVRDSGIPVLPPCVNQSEMDFSVVKISEKHPKSGVIVEKQAIRFGLSAIRGVGEGAVEALLLTRNEKGSFASLFALCERVDLRRINKKVMEALIKAGALDAVIPGRASAMAALDSAVDRAQKAQREKESGQTSLFSLLGGGGGAAKPGSEFGPAPPYPTVADWTPKQKLALEKESLGFYISGHPIDRYAPELRRARAVLVAELTDGDFEIPRGRDRADVLAGGVVSDFRERLLKSGTGKMASFRLEDQTGGIEVVCFSKAYAEYETILRADEPILVTGQLMSDGDGENQQRKINLKEAQLLSQIRMEKTQKLSLWVVADELTADKVSSLKDAFAAHPGPVRISVLLQKPGKWRVEAQLPAEVRVQPTDELLSRLATLCGESAVQLG
jgi:DNA polymerase-3 subunit alpha